MPIYNFITSAFIQLSLSFSKGHSGSCWWSSDVPFPVETTMAQQTTHGLFVFVQYTEESESEEK